MADHVFVSYIGEEERRGHRVRFLSNLVNCPHMRGPLALPYTTECQLKVLTRQKNNVVLRKRARVKSQKEDEVGVVGKPLSSVEMARLSLIIVKKIETYTFFCPVIPVVLLSPHRNHVFDYVYFFVFDELNEFVKFRSVVRIESPALEHEIVTRRTKI